MGKTGVCGIDINCFGKGRKKGEEKEKRSFDRKGLLVKLLKTAQ